MHTEPGTHRAPMRIAVLASGGGSNLGALLAHFDRARAAAVGVVVGVASDKADAGALARAHERGIATHVIDDPRDGPALRAWLQSHRADIVVLAGYLKLVPAEVVAAWPGRMVNVHPALLPAFGGAGMYGARVHAAVVAVGARITGVTVHFVNAQYDRGAIIAQWPVPVFAHDRADDVAARVLRVEHRLLPQVVECLCNGSVVLTDEGTVRGQVTLSPMPDRPVDEFTLPSADSLVDAVPLLSASH
jgi:phosphoribosylglycinamide formyltransferase-1